MKKLSILTSALIFAGCTTTPPQNNISDLTVTYDESKNLYQLNWQATQAKQDVEILVASDEQGSDAKVIASANDDQYQWQSTGAKGRKYFTVKPANGQADNAASRLLPLEKGRNFRELGGYETVDGKTVKWGKLFRSGALANLTNNDYQYIDNLGIKTVVDFRDNNERATEVTDWKASDVEVISKDYGQVLDMKKFAKALMDPSLNEEKATMLFAQMYPSLTETQKENYTAMFNRLATKDDGLLFHCTAGKDRTGVAGVLILTALGVDKEVAIQDYLLSEQYLDPKELFHVPENMSPEQEKMYAFFSKLPEEIVQVFAGTRRPMIEAAISHMETKSGSILNYIQQELNVSEQDLANIRKHYLN
ncbi:tyrosine-protein phosphatase [Thalassotalea profundi]|uniref:Protein-tyrosine-phosphatase n=1 Tax=Thalassotalea profundi TaxID=2036687 RepID=A0ABQ3IVH1_9GAMM|nr:tyrosine-protein phosphatase [Thalassotalea profundi]GHE95972.1 protein-tyrosine-phosphatase [Thalassotalea profundi]